MDIKDAENQLDKADSFITKLWAFLKKHWGKLIVLLLIYGGYRFCVLVGEEIDKKPIQEIEQQISTKPDEPFRVREYNELQKDGTIAVIIVWSDSV